MRVVPEYFGQCLGILVLIGSLAAGQATRPAFHGSGLATGLGPVADVGEWTWEPIAADYSNVRGLNYVPHWAGSSVGTWRHYDPVQVEADLGYFKGIGCNAVRVWMSEAVFREEGAGLLAKFRDFLQRCEDHRIYVMPVLWDAIGSQPSATPYDDTDFWVTNPASSDALDPGYWTQYGAAYVQALVLEAHQSPALLMWDVMNEPGPLPFLQQTAQLIDFLAPANKVTIGWAAAHANIATAHWPEIDVLSYHPYGCFKENIEHWTQRAREISIANGNKPILASELASPGLMQRYEDALTHITAEGVGFMFWQAMIGPPPHFLWFQDGFFYEDGEVRDVEGVQAFQDVSVQQGYAGALLTIVEKPATDPLHLAMWPVELGFGGPEVIIALETWLDRPPLVPISVPPLETKMTWATISIAWLQVLQPSDVAMIQGIIDNFDAAVAAGDYAQADLWLDCWGLFNASFVDLHDLSG